MAPSAKFTHASIIEGVVPNDELNKPIKRDTDPKELRKEIPTWSDPIAMIKYLFE